LRSWYGTDIDDLDSRHGPGTGPVVARLREAAAMPGEDIWTAVKLPREFEDDDDLEDGTAIRRWPPWSSIPVSRAGCARPWPSAPATRTWTRRPSSTQGSGLHGRDNGSL